MAERSEIPVFRNDPALVLILGLVTCGLYLIYWNIKAAKVMNAVAGREAISPAVAAISGCCVPMNVYFYYLCGQCLPELGELIGKPQLSSEKTTLLILGIVLPMVAAMIVQGHMNEIYETRG